MMNRYDLQTHPVSTTNERDLEAPTNPEEIPSLEYPSREEPGKFYAGGYDTAAKRADDSIESSDEQQDTAREVEDGADAAGDATRAMDFDTAQLDQPYEDNGFNGLAANTGPGLRH